MNPLNHKTCFNNVPTDVMGNPAVPLKQVTLCLEIPVREPTSTWQWTTHVNLSFDSSQQIITWLCMTVRIKQSRNKLKLFWLLGTKCWWMCETSCYVKVSEEFCISHLHANTNIKFINYFWSKKKKGIPLKWFDLF